MKKYVLLCLFAGLSLNVLAQDYEDYKLKIDGQIETVIKSQDKFTTPFDYVDWGWSTRAGASEKDSQFARVQGNINLTTGTIGMSEYASMLSLWVDPQSSNDNVELRNGQLGQTVWMQSEKNKVEVTNAFAMWRPFAIKDAKGNLLGRPLGITVGNQSIPATVNAINTNIFKGDLDGDFIGYTTTSLMNKPGIHLDLHTGKFGIGYAYLKGSSDLLNNSAGYSNERSKTQVGYVDANMFGFDFNTAYQYSEGNRKAVDTLGIVKDYFATGNDVSDISIDSEDYAYSGKAINVSLAYNLNLGKDTKFRPFVGYQKTDTDVAPDVIVETANKEYGSNFNIQRVEAAFTTVGGTFETKIFGKKVKFATEYSKCDTPDSKGLDLVYDGQIDYAVQGLFENAGVQATLAGVDAAYGTSYAGTTYNMADAAFKGISGNGKTTYTLAGLDSMNQIEMTVEMTNNVGITLFYKNTESKTVDYKVTDAQVAEIASTISSTLNIDSATAGVLAKGLTDNIEKGIKDSTKWDDNSSIGVSVVCKF